MNLGQRAMQGFTPLLAEGREGGAVMTSRGQAVLRDDDK